MRKCKKMIIASMAISLVSGMTAPLAAFGEEIDVSPVQESGYSVSTADGLASFYDYEHQISIIDSALKDNKDISYYGLNDEGNLATVYFNTEANEGKGIVASNDSMIYITYANGEISEVKRDIGTLELFNFDMSIADPSLEGMMKVFTASLGSFVQAYSGTLTDYSSLSSSAGLSGSIEYTKGSKTTLKLMDDNFISNKDGDPNEAFLANEWGIYSGYQVVDGVDYNTFCFFGDNDDIYYYGYSKTESGYKVLTMKGSVDKVSDREKEVKLSPVDMTKTSDNTSQYITKMASSLMAAQGYTSMNLDTLKLKKTIRWVNYRLTYVIEASTSTASGTLYYKDGAYTGTISDSNGNTETLSVTTKGSNFVVTAQTTGVFTVKNKCDSGSLKESNPSYNKKHSSCCCKPSYCYFWPTFHYTPTYYYSPCSWWGFDWGFNWNFGWFWF